MDDTYYCYKNNGVEIIGAEVSNEPSTLFISYAECDTPIVEGIREKLKDEIEVSRYTGLRYCNGDLLRFHQLYTYMPVFSDMYHSQLLIRNHDPATYP